MNNYEIIELKDNRWNEIVLTFENCDAFYMNEYAKAFSLHGYGAPFLFYYNDRNCKAINVMFKRDIAEHEQFKEQIPKNELFDLISPYGYGGFIIEGDNVEEVYNCYYNYCKSNGIICEFVRFNLFNQNIHKYNGEVKKIKSNIVRKLNMNPEDMLMDFEHKVRKNLKKAENNGLTIQIDEDGKTLDEFLNIYYETMKRNDAKDLYYFKKEFFEILNIMKDNVVYFNVIHEEKIISTELVLYDKKNCYSYLGGTLNEYFELRPNDFLKYEIIKWAYKKKIKNFVLGGGYGNEEDGIFRYKKSFAPNDGAVDFYVGEKIFNEKVYDELMKIRNNINKDSNFFPLYRS